MRIAQRYPVPDAIFIRGGAHDRAALLAVAVELAALVPPVPARSGNNELIPGAEKPSRTLPPAAEGRETSQEPLAVIPLAANHDPALLQKLTQCFLAAYPDLSVIEQFH